MKRNEKSVKYLIAEALLKLLRKKKYEEISVSDLVSEAGVARASFYRNYQNLDDVLNVSVLHIKEQNEKMTNPIFNEKDDIKRREAILRFVDKLGTERTKVFIETNMSVIFSKLYDKYEKENSNKLNIENRYLPYAKMALLMAIIRKWISNKNQDKKEDIADFVLEILKKID